MTALQKHLNRPGRPFCGKACKRMGGCLATNPPCDKPIENYSTLNRGTRQGFCNRGPATKVCNTGGRAGPLQIPISRHSHMCMLYVCIHTYTCIHIYIHIYIYIYIYVYTHASVHMCIYFYIYTHMHSNTPMVSGPVLACWWTCCTGSCRRSRTCWCCWHIGPKLSCPRQRIPEGQSAVLSCPTLRECMHVCLHMYIYICPCRYLYKQTYAYTNTCICIYIYDDALRGPPHPPPNGLGSRPPFCGVGCSGVDWESSFPPCRVGSGGWESPSLLLLLWCGVLSVGIPLPPSQSCGVGSGGWESPSLPFVVRAGKSWWCRIRGPSRVGSPGGREAPLVRQTTFCGRRFCSETLGCPFRCFGRPWRLLLGTIQYRAIKSVLMTSRPAILDYTLCQVLYTIYF